MCIRDSSGTVPECDVFGGTLNFAQSVRLRNRPRKPRLDFRGLLLRERRKEERGGEEIQGITEGRGGKGKVPRLLLNQGPSEPCYATVSSGGCRKQLQT